LLGRIEPARDAFNAAIQLTGELRENDESQLNLVVAFEALVEQASFELEVGELDKANRILADATETFQLLETQNEEIPLGSKLLGLYREISDRMKE
jgi:hypothetical protein